VVRWFLDADDNPDSHEILIISFWPIYNVSLKFVCKFIPWYLHLVDKLTNRKYAKTINLLCAGNKVFVKNQAQGGVLTPTPCVRPRQTIIPVFGFSGKLGIPVVLLGVDSGYSWFNKQLTRPRARTD